MSEHLEESVGGEGRSELPAKGAEQSGERVSMQAKELAGMRRIEL